MQQNRHRKAASALAAPMVRPSYLLAAAAAVPVPAQQVARQHQNIRLAVVLLLLILLRLLSCVREKCSGGLLASGLGSMHVGSSSECTPMVVLAPRCTPYCWAAANGRGPVDNCHNTGRHSFMLCQIKLAALFRAVLWHCVALVYTVQVL